MSVIKLYDYVKKKSPGLSFSHMSNNDKIKYLSEYLEDIVEYLSLKIERLEGKLLDKNTVILKKKKK